MLFISQLLNIPTRLFRVCGAFSARTLSSYILVKDAESLKLPQENVTVFGWVRSARKQKMHVFVDVNDGSSLRSLQVIVPSEQLIDPLNLGCSVVATGSVVESTHPGQKVEMQATGLTVVGACDPQEYPFAARTRHGLEYTRQFPHLRPRSNAFSALLRIRNTATMAIHEFLQERQFVHVHTPILTSSDCEGAGDLFRVQPARDESSNGEEFFGNKTYLTVSGQLHAEAVCSAMKSVYTFGPTFRAERSETRRHLSEFYMVEAETVTMETGLSGIVELIESLYKYTLEKVLKRSCEDVRLYHDRVAEPEVKTRHDVEGLGTRLVFMAGIDGFRGVWLHFWRARVEHSVFRSLEQPFKHLTYTEAIEILTAAHKKKRFQYEPKWGTDLQSEHEWYLVSHCGQLPVFVTHYPAAIKPFYAKATDDSSDTVSAVDLLLPLVGEVVGGTLREERPEVLHSRLQRLGMLEKYQWYLDLRRFGTMPHGGFGLGFERFLQAVLGVKNIRDVVPFPRYLGSCQF